MSSVYVVGTFDTKGDELQYVAALIAAEGVPAAPHPSLPRVLPGQQHGTPPG